MVLRIILSIIICIILVVILFFIRTIILVKKLIPITVCICEAFDQVFGMYLTEGVFSRDHREEITILKLHLEFSNLEEACDCIEKYTIKTIKEYDKHTYFLRYSAFQEKREELVKIKAKINWLRKEF